MCPDCKKLRHEGDCPDLCEGCGWPLAAGQDRLCDECALEIGHFFPTYYPVPEYDEVTNERAN